MPILRKIVLYLFIAIYLLVCPLLILRMLGYVISPSTHHLVKTGLIYVSTNPSGASVFIDGREAHETTPTVIRDLVPGEHFLRVQLNGHKNWTRTIIIAPKKATSIENLLLIPDQWKFIAVSRTPYDQLTPPNHLLANNGNTLEDILTEDPLAEEILHKLPQPLNGYTIDKEHQTLLAWTAANMALVDYSDKLRVQWLPLPALHVTQAFWINNGSAILFLKDNTVFLLNKEDFDRACFSEIVTVKDNSRISFTEKTGKLYYLDPITHVLMNVQIVNHKPFIPRPIAETLRLRKFEE